MEFHRYRYGFSFTDISADTWTDILILFLYTFTTDMTYRPIYRHWYNNRYRYIGFADMGRYRPIPICQPYIHDERWDCIHFLSGVDSFKSVNFLLPLRLLQSCLSICQPTKLLLHWKQFSETMIDHDISWLIMLFRDWSFFPLVMVGQLSLPFFLTSWSIWIRDSQMSCADWSCFTSFKWSIMISHDA